MIPNTKLNDHLVRSLFKKAFKYFGALSINLIKLKILIPRKRPNIPPMLDIKSVKVIFLSSIIEKS